MSSTVFSCRERTPYVETTSVRRAVCPSVHHLVSAAKPSDRYVSHLVQEFVLDKLVFVKIGFVAGLVYLTG
jgi:hypothetical protein